MKHREIANATEQIAANFAVQAQALFPQAPATIIRGDGKALIRKALIEARRMHPQDILRQVAYAQARADDAIRRNLADFKGTMH